MVQGLRSSEFRKLRVEGLGFGFWVLGSGFRVQGFGFRVWGLGFWVQGFGFRVQGSGRGCKVPGC